VNKIRRAIEDNFASDFFNCRRERGCIGRLRGEQIQCLSPSTQIQHVRLYGRQIDRSAVGACNQLGKQTNKKTTSIGWTTRKICAIVQKREKRKTNSRWESLSCGPVPSSPKPLALDHIWPLFSATSHSQYYINKPRSISTFNSIFGHALSLAALVACPSPEGTPARLVFS
jgi:hypothetical protein